MKMNLRLPFAAASVLAASDVGFHSYYHEPTNPWRSYVGQKKRPNPNAAKQKAAKRARKTTKGRP